MARLDGLFFSEAHDTNLRVGKDSSWNDAVVHAVERLVRERVVGGNASVVAADRRSALT